jgi:hypothetical protein
MARAFEELDKQVKLEKASDPDRMKGAIHVIWNKSISMLLICQPENVRLTCTLVNWVVSRETSYPTS